MNMTGKEEVWREGGGREKKGKTQDKRRSYEKKGRIECLQVMPSFLAINKKVCSPLFAFYVNYCKITKKGSTFYWNGCQEIFLNFDKLSKKYLKNGFQVQVKHARP